MSGFKERLADFLTEELKDRDPEVLGEGIAVLLSVAITLIDQVGVTDDELAVYISKIRKVNDEGDD